MRGFVTTFATAFVSFASAALLTNDVSLVLAAQAPDAAPIERLFQRKDLSATAKDGTTALHWAVHHDDLQGVEQLIRAGANVNLTNRYGVMPLWLAVTNANRAITEALLQAGANPNASLPGRHTVLMLAARTGNPDVVQALLARGADVNVTEQPTGETALMWAAAEGHAAAVKVLLDAGANIQARTALNWPAFFYAVRKGDINSVRALIAAGVNVNETLDPETARGYADTAGDDAALLSPKGDSMLVLAIVNGHFELADVLLQNGADPNAAGTRWSPLHALARIRNHEEVLHPAPVPTGRLDSLELAKRLLARGGNPHTRAMTKTAKRPGADRNYLEFMGATPFLLAAKAADLPLMRLLLAAGVNPHTPTSEQTTPLMVAAGIGCSPGQWLEPEREVLQTVKILVEELGADLHAVNIHGETALHGAAYRGMNSVVQYLVDKGARLDAKDHEGRTPLAVAEGVPKPIEPGGPPIVTITNPQTVPLLRKLMAGSAGENQKRH